jgi:hypothetical protein
MIEITGRELAVEDCHHLFSLLKRNLGGYRKKTAKWKPM